MAQPSDEWVLDVTNEPDVFYFCPIDKDGTVISGMIHVSDRAPGVLVGVVSFNGQKHADRWVEENPSWKVDFCNVSELSEA